MSFRTKEDAIHFAEKQGTSSFRPAFEFLLIGLVFRRLGLLHVRLARSQVRIPAKLPS